MPKVMVVIPEDLLKEVDGAVQESRTNRSTFICRSLRAQLRSAQLQQIRRRILNDAQAIAQEFHTYWNPDEEPMWMAAENEALKLVEEGGPVYFRTILSAPISASPKAQQRTFTVSVAAGEGGLSRDSTVLVFQIRTLDRARFIKKIGHLPPRRMAEVERAILVCFGMEHLLV